MTEMSRKATSRRYITTKSEKCWMSYSTRLTATSLRLIMFTISMSLFFEAQVLKRMPTVDSTQLVSTVTMASLKKTTCKPIKNIMKMEAKNGQKNGKNASLGLLSKDFK